MTSNVTMMDAFRAGKDVGRMLVSEHNPAFDKDPNLLLADMAKMDGAALLADYSRRQLRFGTSPFDPDGARLKFFVGGLTVWSGYPGAGKTTLLRQMVCHCLHRKSAVFLASLEESVDDIIVNLAATAAGQEIPTVHQLQWLLDEHGPRLKLWTNPRAGTPHRHLLAVIRELAGQGVRHAIIDSMMCLDIKNDDFEGQRKFANLLAASARAAQIHIHLVAHPRKAISASQEPDINDVAGARELGGIADNVIFVRRSQNESELKGDATPMHIVVKKQRHGSGYIGNIPGWFNRKYRQFHVSQFPTGPTRYLPDDAYEESPQC